MIETVRILVTGDRDWLNRSLVYDVIYKEVLTQKLPIILTHGEADGADKIAGWAVRELQGQYRISEDPHPAEWYKIGAGGKTYFDKGAGPKRNDKMLNLRDPQVSHVHAFHNDIDSSKGTRHCVLGAIKRQMLITLHTDFGSVEIDSRRDYENLNPVTQKEAERILLDASHRLRPLSW